VGSQSSLSLAYSDGPFKLAAHTYDIKYHASKNHGNANTLSWLLRKTAEESEDWLKEGHRVNRVQIERMPITANRIREATRGDPVLSWVLHFVLHGWQAEESTPEELRFYRAKREELQLKQQEVLPELHLNHPGMVRMKSLARLRVWWPNLGLLL